MLETLCAKVSLKLCLKESGCKSFQSIFSLLVRSLFAEKEKGKKGEGMRSTGSPNTAFKWKMHTAT